jgi:hypothetical protein
MTIDRLHSDHADVLRDALHAAIRISFGESSYLHSYGGGDRQSVDYALDRMEYDEEGEAFCPRR